MEELRANPADTTLTVPQYGTRVDVKRLYLPGYVIKTKCPKCGVAHKIDLGHDSYLSFPQSGARFDIHACCYEDACMAEFYVPVKLTVSLELVGDPKPRAKCSCSHHQSEHGPSGCRGWFGDLNTGYRCSCEWDGVTT